MCMLRSTSTRLLDMFGIFLEYWTQSSPVCQSFCSLKSRVSNKQRPATHLHQPAGIRFLANIWCPYAVTYSLIPYMNSWSEIYPINIMNTILGKRRNRNCLSCNWRPLKSFSSQKKIRKESTKTNKIKTTLRYVIYTVNKVREKDLVMPKRDGLNQISHQYRLPILVHHKMRRARSTLKCK